MSLSATELARVVEELRPALVGSLVQKISAPANDRLVFSFHTRAGRADLLLCAAPGASRAHLLSERPPNPDQPPAFCMLLRKYLDGARLSEVLQPEGDRRLRLVFSRREPAGALEIELYGRAPNVFFVAPDGLIAGRLSSAAAKERPNNVGEPYQAPAPAPARSEAAPRFADSAEVEGFYRASEKAQRDAVALAARRKELTARAERARRALRAVESDLARSAENLGARRIGELLLQNLRSLTKGATRARVTDYSSGEAVEVEVPLDPALGPKENAERAFHRYRRAERAQQLATARQTELRGELERLEGELSSLVPGSVESAPAPQTRAQKAPAKKRVEARALPYREYTSRNGDRIWVGKSAKDNDALTTQHARGGDLWLHARDSAGSHVVVPLAKHSHAHQETLLDAAMLAVHFSKSRGEALVDVTYAPAKQVRKIKGTPGLVSVSGGKTLRVRMEAERVQRILQSQARDDA